jgi:hypothetical protein
VKKIDLVEPIIKKRDRRAIRQEMERIRHGRDLLKPEDVVASARNGDSSLHRYFEWDDTVAGDKFRLMQARTLIREIKVVSPDDPQERLVPRFISLGSDRRQRGGGYRETAVVLSNEQLRKELETTARKELEAWTGRYEMLTGLVNKVRAAAGLGKKRSK